MKQAIICGAKEFGMYAYWELFKKYEIIAFVDINDEYTVGTLKTAVEIDKIGLLDDISRNMTIIIAVEDETNRKIANELINQLGFKFVVNYYPSSAIDEEVVKKYCIDRAYEAIEELKQNRSINVADFLSRNFDSIPLKEMTFAFGGSGMLDYAFLYAIAKKYNCKKYLEVGTYIGESINVLTDICDELHCITAPSDSKYSMKRFCKIENIPDYSSRLVYSDKIITHYCEDSKVFDYSVIDKDIDLYFIDADHSFTGVYFDTRNVFEHRKPNSIVIWHDFKNGDPININEVAWAVKSYLSDEEWQNVFCVDTNMCGIYLPPQLQKDFQLRRYEYSETPQDLYCYDVELKLIKQR